MNRPRIAAIIPVGSLEVAKSRLGGALDAEERLDLAERFLSRTLEAALATTSLDDVVVISPDRDVLHRAAELGARTLRQRSIGLNAGLDEGRADVVAGGADAIVVLPIDLPLLTSGAIEAVLGSIAGDDDSPRVVLVTDRHGSGTNVLALRPPDVIDFRFGLGSREAHAAAATAAGARYIELGGPLAFDLDTPADLVLFEGMASEGIGVG